MRIKFFSSLFGPQDEPFPTHSVYPVVAPRVNSLSPDVILDAVL